MNEELKKLTGKNKNEYEPIAAHMVSTPDVELFRELVEQEDFLFDFVKSNVAQRIYDACNESNYKNLLKFFKYYSPSYEDAMIEVLAKYADEDLTDEMLELFEKGTDEEKCYCAKFFSYIQDPLALDLLRKNSYTDNENLNANCASTLGILKDRQSYEGALEMLKSKDEFEKLSAVKFLVYYGNIDALDSIVDAMKTSTMSENIAGFVPYLIGLEEFIEQHKIEGLFVLNNIIYGLGEIISLCEVINFELYDVFAMLIAQPLDSKTAVVLLNAEDKFKTLTENDEYLFDEDKNTQAEIKDIKKLLSKFNKKQAKILLNQELNENSQFVYTALEFAENTENVKELLRCNNQTIILKTAEVLKKLGALDDTARTVALLKITDDNIKSILRAL